MPYLAAPLSCLRLLALVVALLLTACGQMGPLQPAPPKTQVQNPQAAGTP